MVMSVGPGGAVLSRAAELRSRGVAENNAGHPAQAIRLFRRALAMLDRSGDAASHQGQVLSARIVISMAMSDSELNGLERGLASLRGVEDYVERTGDLSVAVHLHCQLGYMRVRGGHFSAGLAELNIAETMLAHTQPAEACNILINRGMVHVFLSDLPRARTDYLRAVREAQRHGLLVEEKKARHNLGELEFFAGNLALALQLMDEAAALDAEVSAAVALVDRAKVLIEAGLYRDADEALVRAGELFRRDRLWKDVGEVELARAECALLDGEAQAARRLAASARDRFRRRGNDRWRRDAELVLLQADLAAGRPGSRLTPPALRLAAEFSHDGLTIRTRTAQLIAAEALLRAGLLDEARALATTVGPVRPADPISARLHTRLVRAKVLLAAGGRSEAKREIRTGLRELARHQSRFGSIDLQTASAVHGRQLTELDVALGVAGGKAADVLASVERGRAISSRLQAVAAPQDPVAAELLSELRQLTEELRTIESDSAAIKRVSGDRRRATEIQQLLRSRAWRSEGPGQAVKPATLTQTVDALSSDGSAFVAFVLANGGLNALVLGEHRPRMVALAPAVRVNELVRRLRADLDVMAHAQLPAALAVAVSAAMRRSLISLDEMLLAPLRLTNPRLIISPTGPLATLPWGLLPSLRGCPVVVAPSATAWLTASSASSDAQRPTSPVALFAGPDLEFVSDELKGIESVWGQVTSFSGVAATQQELQRAMATSTVVHIAAHGQHQTENPLFSSIRLSGGPVFAYEFDRSASAAEHVILSACELGQATIRPGDEALGWTSVLLHLGTRSVVSGVAGVHDGVAAQVMVRYHQLLAAGTDSAQALALAVSESDGPPAPFVCFGATWRP
jgi:tetratricopeptide (TPR) repeat protein